MDLSLGWAVKDSVFGRVLGCDVLGKVHLKITRILSCPCKKAPPNGY
jgi:hypothetical protein